MTREELIKYCRYYKGEKTCPFKRGSTDYIFWHGEKKYIDYAYGRYGKTNPDEWCKNWELRAEYYAKHSRKENNILFSDANMHTKGIAYQIKLNLGKFMPYAPAIINSY